MVKALVEHAADTGFLSVQASLHVGNVSSCPPREHAKYTLRLSRPR